MFLAEGQNQNGSRVSKIGSFNPFLVLVEYLKGFRTISIAKKIGFGSRHLRYAGRFLTENRGAFFSGAKISHFKSQGAQKLNVDQWISYRCI